MCLFSSDLDFDYSYALRCITIYVSLHNEMIETCAFCVVVKVRIQLGQGSAVSVTKNMLKNDGIGAFYKV